jgi:Protein of unknown function DUF115
MLQEEMKRVAENVARAGMSTARSTWWKVKHRPRLAAFRNRHVGEKCFVIGNGPSLNGMDLSLMQGSVRFGLNKIYLLFERSGLHVDYHVAVNPLVIRQSAAEFAQLRCPSFLAYSAAVDQPVTANNFRYLFTGGDFRFSGDITLPIHEGYTVTFVALQIAYYMGFREVYLIGVDHRFQATGAPNQKAHMIGPDPNHFDPNYFKGHDWNLPDLEASELGYRMAQFAYRRQGREIFDATVGGALNVFPKISYEEALRRCRIR